MKKEDINKKTATATYSMMRLILALLALIFLVLAAFAHGEEHIGAKFILILIAAFLLTASITTFLLERGPA